MSIGAAIADAAAGSTFGPIGTIAGGILGLLTDDGGSGGSNSAAKQAVLSQAINGTQNDLAPTMNMSTNSNVYVPPFNQAKGYASGTDSAPPPGVLSAFGSVQPPPMINANDVSSNQIDPALSQAILTKIAAGQPLLPAEQAAASKLPPSVLAHAALSGTAPLPDKAKEAGQSGPPAPMYGTAQSKNAYGQGFVSGPSEGQPVGQDIGGRSFGPPMGNSAENQGMQANGHYAGKASYSGSTITDPLVQNPVAAVPSVASSSPQNNTRPATMPSNQVGTAQSKQVYGDTSPNVKAAQAVVASPDTPPSLKGMNGQQIAQMIGNILDVVGVGLSARGGVQRQTMLQNRMQLERETTARNAQAMGQAGANVYQAQGQAAVDIDKARQLLPLEEQIKLDNAIKLNDHETAQRIFEANQTVNPKIMAAAGAAVAGFKAQLEYLRGVAKLAAGPGGSSPAIAAAQDAAKNMGQ